MAPRQLIVGGWPDAAAHDVAFVLSEHPRVLLGFERYTQVLAQVEMRHLAPKRILDPLPQETHVRGELLYERLYARRGRRGLDYTGDAAGRYLEIVDELAERLPNGRIVLALGPPPVHNAQQAAWREAAQRTRATEAQAHRARIFMLPWDRWLDGEEPWLEALLAFLELPGSPRLDAEWARLRAAAQPPAAPGELSDPGAAELELWRMERGAAELGLLADAPELPRRDDRPLSEEDIGAREAERAQLFDELTRQHSDWPDELERLRRRQAEDAYDIWLRGNRIRERSLTAAPGLPDHSFRLTVINPYERREVLGRGTLNQLASSLGRLVHVRLIQRHSSPVLWADVTVSEELDEETVRGEADAILCPALTPVLARLNSWIGDGDRLVLLLNEPGGLDVVCANPGREVIATAAWLARAARELGVPALYVPLGLHRRLDEPVLPMHERGLTVSALGQAGEAHGSDDLEDALILIREANPETEIVVFGDVPLDGATTYFPHPRLETVVEMLRTSAVHIVPSRTDGSGLMGAMALAAGSALVTTATDGAAEHVVPGRTAQVVPIGDWRTMASAALELLEDDDARARMAAEGSRYVRRVFPPWAEVGRRLALILTATP
jgi:hypothetical protein